MCELDTRLEHIADNKLLLTESNVLNSDINVLITKSDYLDDSLKIVTEAVLNRWSFQPGIIELDNVLKVSVPYLLNQLTEYLNVKFDIQHNLNLSGRTSLVNLSNLNRFKVDSSYEIEGDFVRNLSVRNTETGFNIFIGNNPEVLEQHLFAITRNDKLLKYTESLLNELKALCSNLDEIDIDPYLENDSEIFDPSGLYDFDKGIKTLLGGDCLLFNSVFVESKTEFDKYCKVPSVDTYHKLIELSKTVHNELRTYSKTLTTVNSNITEIRELLTDIVNNLDSTNINVYCLVNFILGNTINKLISYNILVDSELTMLCYGLDELLTESTRSYNADFIYNTDTLDHTNLLVAEYQSDIDELDHDGDLLQEDFGIALDLLDKLDSTDGEVSTLAVESYNCALNTIRRRWNIKVTTESYGKSNRQIIREDVWDSIADFFRKISDWIKEQIHKLKGKWVEITNKGTKMQKRADEFLARLNKAGTVSKNSTIEGSFIKQLSIGKDFKGDVSTVGEAIKACYDLRDTQSRVVSEANSAIKLAANTTTDSAAMVVAIAGIEKHYTCKSDDFKPNKSSEILGHKVFSWITTTNESDTDVEITLDDSDTDFPSEVNVPDKTTVANLINAYKKAGTDIEKISKNYVDTARKLNNLSDSSSKLVRILENKNADNDNLKDVVSKARNILKSANVINSGVERTVTHLMGCLAKGLTEYIDKSISSY